MGLKKHFFISLLLIFCSGIGFAQVQDSTTNRSRGGAIRATDSTNIVYRPAAVQPKPDSLPVVFADSTLLADKKKSNWVRRFFTKDYPNPRKAMFMSLIIPGSGQIYNRSWWKVPIVYGALGTMIYVEANNVRVYRALKTAYFNKVNDLPVESRYQPFDAFSIKRARDSARKQLELTSVGLGLTVLLITAEAFTDAHLKQFDVSDDLSFKFKPVLTPSHSGVASYGLSLRMSF